MAAVKVFDVDKVSSPVGIVDPQRNAAVLVSGYDPSRRKQFGSGSIHIRTYVIGAVVPPP